MDMTVSSFVAWAGLIISLFSAVFTFRTSKANREMAEAAIREFEIKRELLFFVLPKEDFVANETTFRIKINAGAKNCFVHSLKLSGAVFKIEKKYLPELTLNVLLESSKTFSMEFESFVTAEEIIFDLLYENLDGDKSVLQHAYAHLPEGCRN